MRSEMNDVKTPTERFLSLTGIITKLHGHDHVITPEVEKLKRDLFNHALYAFSATSGHSIVCFAHVTNSMAQTEGDFEKASPMAQRRRWPSSPRRLAPGAVGGERIAAARRWADKPQKKLTWSGIRTPQ